MRVSASETIYFPLAMPYPQPSTLPEAENKKRGIFKYLDKGYKRSKYDREYKLANKVHGIRTIVAHAKENDMSPFVFVDSLSHHLEYSRSPKASA